MIFEKTQLEPLAAGDMFYCKLFIAFLCHSLLLCSNGIQKIEILGWFPFYDNI